MRTKLDLVVRRVVRIVGLGCLLAAASGASPAQQVRVTLDPSQTKIHIAVHDIHGGFQGDFRLKKGAVTYDPATGTAGGEIVVDATSGTTGNDRRDRKMHKEILETERYPEIAFLPKRVTGAVAPQGSSNLQVQGVFRIHGGDHELTVSVPLTVSGDTLTGTASFVVPYESWGIKNPSVLFLKVDGEAQVSIALAGKMTAAQTAASGR